MGGPDLLIEAHDGTVRPDYFQFYLRTGRSEYTSAAVSGTGYEARLEATSPGFVCVGTLKVLCDSDPH
ncbi:MAG TPA: hypothetical protein VGU71_13460 [Candidatus Dormibacteraeota bacterium]|nr:hypothetical protein [Candidatus Dormibacteraeota bacterium]